MGGSVLLLVTRCKLESSVVWMKSQRHERTLPVNILSNIVVPFLHTACPSVCLSNIVAPFLHTGRFSVSFEPLTHDSFLYRTSLRLRGTLP